MADLFVSYSWTTRAHRDWVRLLASSIQALGYEVLFDEDVDYGNTLTGFMQRVTECDHVLIVADEEYVRKANSPAASGVRRETDALQRVYDERPTGWLAVVMRDNPSRLLPEWLQSYNPKYFSFNSTPGEAATWGEQQLEDVWRWMEGLPANRLHEVPAKELRARAARLEHINAARDPARWRSPHLQGEVEFAYEDAPRNTYTFGVGQYEFSLDVSGRGADGVYVYADPANISAVGLLVTGASDGDPANALRPGRTVAPRIGESVVLMNQHGALATVQLLAVTPEESLMEYRPASIKFRWNVLPEAGLHEE